MLKTIKELKLEDLEKELEPKERHFKEIIAKLDELEKEGKTLKQQLNSNNLIIKLFKKKSINDRLTEITQQITELDSERRQITMDLTRERGRITNSQTLEELGMDFNQAVAFLNEHNYPVVLDESDSYIQGEKFAEDQKRKIGPLKDLSDLVLVRKEKHAPEGAMLKPSGTEKGHDFVGTVNILGTTYNYSYPSSRNTIHFAVNGEVGDHAMGSWQDCRYAILMPYTDAPISQLIGANTADTYFEGRVPLNSNSIILCPKEEQAEIVKNNPNVIVYGYEGPNVTGYTQGLISLLGYSAQHVGQNSWQDNNATNEYNKIMRDNGLDKLSIPHSESKNSAEVKKIQNISELIAIFNIIKNNDLIKSEEDIVKIYEDIKGIVNGKVNFFDQNLYRRLDESGIILPLECSRIFSMPELKQVPLDVNLINNYLNQEDNKFMRDKIKTLLDSYQQNRSMTDQELILRELKVIVFINEVCKGISPTLINKQEEIRSQ